MRIWRESDVSVQALRGRTVAVIGYGNQGRAHALNLRDSGLTVVVGQRPGKSWDQARFDGFEPLPIAEATAQGSLIILALPDEVASDVFVSEIASRLSPGSALGFVHGFNIRFGLIRPPAEVDVILVAPKGPGSLVRSLYESGMGVPALFAVHQDASGGARDIALGWAAALGAARAGLLETTFAAETETDLFGEQVVLCGGISALCRAAFDTLVEAGYDPVFAYLECVHELKQVVDLLYARGLTGMRERISHTAEYGDLTRGPRIVSDETRKVMRRILEEIQSGAFAREWIAEHRAGGERFRRLHCAEEGSDFERAGARVRALMPWLHQGE